MNVFVMAQVVYLFNCRHLRRSALTARVLEQPVGVRWRRPAMVLLQVA